MRFFCPTKIALEMKSKRLEPMEFNIVRLSAKCLIVIRDRFIKEPLSLPRRASPSVGICTLFPQDLSVANLSRADLLNADLNMANLRGANLSEAALRGVNLCGAEVTNTQFGEGIGLSASDKKALKERGALFNDSPIASKESTD